MNFLKSKLFLSIQNKKKIDINNYITTEIKKINQNINITKIEVFKERIMSFLLRYYFISKKKIFFIF